MWLALYNVFVQEFEKNIQQEEALGQRGVS
jgi:hypothetical protein